MVVLAVVVCLTFSLVPTVIVLRARRGRLVRSLLWRSLL